jgi:hypothetical protein
MAGIKIFGFKGLIRKIFRTKQLAVEVCVGTGPENRLAGFGICRQALVSQAGVMG